MQIAQNLKASVCTSQGYAGDDQLGEALQGCDVVIIPAGVPRKPGMTRDDLFKVGSLKRFSSFAADLSFWDWIQKHLVSSFVPFMLHI